MSMSVCQQCSLTRAEEALNALCALRTNGHGWVGHHGSIERKGLSQQTHTARVV